MRRFNVTPQSAPTHRIAIRPRSPRVRISRFTSAFERSGTPSRPPKHPNTSDSGTPNRLHTHIRAQERQHVQGDATENRKNETNSPQRGQKNSRILTRMEIKINAKAPFCFPRFPKESKESKESRETKESKKRRPTRSSREADADQVGAGNLRKRLWRPGWQTGGRKPT
jgi:hypothetical protein